MGLGPPLMAKDSRLPTTVVAAPSPLVRYGRIGCATGYGAGSYDGAGRRFSSGIYIFGGVGRHSRASGKVAVLNADLYSKGSFGSSLRVSRRDWFIWHGSDSCPFLALPACGNVSCPIPQ